MKENKLTYHKNPGFKVPDNYFEGLEDKMLELIKEQQDLDPSYKGAPGFVVPDAYFHSLEEKVLNKIGSIERKNKVIPLYRKRKFYYFAAAAAVFLGIISTLMFNPVTPEYSIDSIELSTLENYIDDGFLDLDYNEISPFITEEGYSFGNISTSELSDEAVFDYINENIEEPGYLLE